MGQLHKIIEVVELVVAFLVVVGVPGLAQTNCSLTVHVLDPQGRYADALVSVEERSGRIKSLQQETGPSRFCDLGALPVTVKVGFDGTCNQVIVRNVPVAWNTKNQLTVTYDVSPCQAERPPSPIPVCRVLFRISNSNGEWVSGIPVVISTPEYTVLSADEFGRASFVVKIGDKIEGIVEKKGYGSQKFRFRCDRLEPVHEELIRLTEKNSETSGER